MRVPDCYWCQDDVIKCFPTTVNIPDTDMKKKNIDVMLGDYEVWEDSTFNICDYRCQFDKIDNRGIFKMALIQKE